LLLTSTHIKTNVTWETLLAYREVGYIKEVIEALIGTYDLSEFEIWVFVHFDFLEEDIRIEKTDKRQIIAHFPRSFIRFSNGFHCGLTPEEYSARLYDSQIVLCPPGLSQPETIRHYEAMRAGCIVILEPLPDTYFYRNSPIIIIRNWREAQQKILHLLANPAEMVSLQHQILDWWNNRCAEKAAAQYIFSKLQTLSV
jgi:hypothetical protein